MVRVFPVAQRVLSMSMVPGALLAESVPLYSAIDGSSGEGNYADH